MAYFGFILNLVLGFCYFAAKSTNAAFKSLATILILFVSIPNLHLIFAAEPAEYLPVTGPCHLEFPEDHGAHPGYRTEWWYYTGNMRSETGYLYGFQLTFFRSQISPPGADKAWPNPPSAWRTQQIYSAHAAVSDVTEKRHLQAELVSREALTMAGATPVTVGHALVDGDLAAYANASTASFGATPASLSAATPSRMRSGTFCSMLSLPTRMV